MSLLRLLTAGKSLVGLRKAETRYRLPDDMGLPRFGSKKNPFRATVLPDKPEPDQESGAQAPPSSSPTTGDRDDEIAFAEKKILAPKDKPVLKPLEPAARRGSAVKAFLLWGRVRKVKPTRMATGKPMIQGELSLDAVKVVRNDLSESDVEIVPGTKRAVSKEPVSCMTAALERSVAQPAGWGALAGRVLGMGT